MGRKASKRKPINSSKASGKQDSTRVLQEQLKRRTADLAEARSQQTATAEILDVIANSPADVQPVLDAVVSAATRFCGAEDAAIGLCVGDEMVVSAHEGPISHTIGRRDRVDRTTVAGQSVLDARTVHVPDILAADATELTITRQLGREFGYRAIVAVPMMREGRAIGMLFLRRALPGAFAERQIALLETFAAQAVIAIENTRLFNETQEALERQTATAEILKIISASPGELEPVFQAMLANAVRLCEAGFGVLYRYEDGAFEPAAMLNAPKPYSDFVWSRGRFLPQSGNTLDRLLKTRQVIEIVDELAEPFPTPAGKLGGARSLVAVPMLKEDSLIGGMAIYRQDVRPFGDKQIELVQNFAAQAVIAIENTRLLKELRERTDQVAELNRGLEARVAEQVEELGRVGRLKRFLAPQLAELIVSQGDEKILESHRREIVVVFCDLRGYTAFTETAEPEEVLDFLGKYHGALGPLVSQFEGTLDQFSGDGIMVFFNDPMPVPDPAERAVNMAVAMREAASSLTTAWRERGRELGFGAGIAQGYATLGQIGFSERSGYTAIGTVCNVAARLCGEAKDGQILLSQRVNVALKGSVATEQVGALALKGLTQPVVTYNVPLTAGQPALRVIDGGNH
jgi:class 3 adenylate cyclase/putative methionine-R-sulfoxide reductase with GAF domain